MLTESPVFMDPFSFSKGLKSLLSEMLILDHNSRPTAEYLLKDPYLEKMKLKYPGALNEIIQENYSDFKIYIETTQLFSSEEIYEMQENQQTKEEPRKVQKKQIKKSPRKLRKDVQNVVDPELKMNMEEFSQMALTWKEKNITTLEKIFSTKNKLNINRNTEKEKYRFYPEILQVLMKIINWMKNPTFGVILSKKESVVVPESKETYVWDDVFNGKECIDWIYTIFEFKTRSQAVNILINCIVYDLLQVLNNFPLNNLDNQLVILKIENYRFRKFSVGKKKKKNNFMIFFFLIFYFFIFDRLH